MSAKPVSKTKATSNPAGLYRWNIWLAAVLALQGVAILALSAVRSFPVTTSFLGVNTLASQSKSQAVLATGVHHLFDINLAYLVAGFFFIAAIAHGLAATKLRDTYEKYLKKGSNPIRWIEYAFSASTMLLVTAVFSGMVDISSLVMLFALSGLLQLLALVMELRGTQKEAMLIYVAGGIAGIVPWLVLGAYLLSAQLYGNLPGYVVAAYGVTLVFFIGLGATATLQYRKKGKWADYLFGERMFMILGLLAKTALAWLVFAGSLRP
jgi:hypothetical protein